MSRVRFATARALYETFPEVAKRVGVEPTDQNPIEFAKALVAQGKAAEAATFCAYLLPRREAVWWACGCVRSLLGEIPQSRATGLLVAEAWVYEPDDEHRLAALEAGTKGDSNDPLTWCALGAGWAGGLLISNPKKQVPMPQYMTARAARIAIIVGSLSVRRDRRPERLAACVAEGLKLAETGL
jgi:hypothetical protein